jgi:hypothetical protein
MPQNKFLDELFAQKMNRKEFLARIGATVLTLVGVTGLLKTLSGLSHSPKGTTYGATPYGGKDKTGTVAPYEQKPS